MPPNTSYVGRGRGEYGKYGNPYELEDYDRDTVLKLYEKWLDEKLAEDPAFLDELIGKDLACWCSLDEDCHADILLRRLEGHC